MDAVPESSAGSLPLASAPSSPRRMFVLLFLASLLAQALIYGALTRRPVIRSDGVGYYAYLPAVFQDRDASLKTLEQREIPHAIPRFTGVNEIDGRYVIKYPVGEAILLFPFFLGSWLIAAVAGVTSAFGWPYQAGAALSGAFYFAAGGAITWAFVRERFGERLATLALVLTVFGTNLFHYATYDAIFSHVYSFFLTATLLWVSRDLAGNASAREWSATGLAVGLIVMTRPTNALFALFVLVPWVERTGSLRAAAKRVAERFRFVLLAGAAALLPLALQIAYWRAATGRLFVYAYAKEGFDFLHPRITEVLFSIEKGTFVWMPLTLVAVFGLFAGRKKLGLYFPALLCFGALNVWMIAAWHDWAYGGSLGTRPFVEASPLFALALAAAFSSAEEHATRARWLFRLSIACAVYTCLMAVGYWTRTIPEGRATTAHIVKGLTLAWLRR